MTRRRTLLASLLTASAALVVAATSPPAGAADLPVSQSRGFFLAGSVAGQDLATAVELADAHAVNTGGAAVEDANPLAATVLGALTIPVGSQTVPIGEGLTFGVLTQYAQAAPDGSSSASSGAIADNGAIQTGGGGAGSAGSMTLDLQALARASGLPTGELTALGDASLTAGALAGRAARAPFTTDGGLGAAGGSYTIGSLTLDVTGAAALTDLLATITDAATGVRDAVQDAIDTYQGTLPTGGVLTVDGTLPDPAALVGSVASVSGPGYVADLQAGTLQLDLVQIVEAASGKNIDALDPNTDLLALIVGALPDIAAHIAAQIGAQLDTARTAFLDALGGVTVSVAGIPVPITGEALSTFLPAFATLTAPLSDAVSGFGAALGTLFDQLGSALQTLVSLVANAQSTAPDQTFTETALALGVLPSTSATVPTALQLDLGNAAVGPGAPQVVASTPPPPPTPVSEVPTLANTGPYETVAGLALGTWALVAGTGLLMAANSIRRARRFHEASHRR